MRLAQLWTSVKPLYHCGVINHACLELYAPENVAVGFSNRTHSLQNYDGKSISPIRIMGFTYSWLNLELQMLLDFSLTEWDRRNWTIGTVLILKPSIF